MADRDEDWLDALAGAGAPADAGQQRELEALRRAARALEAAPPDALAEQRLLRRLEGEGLLEAPLRRRAGPLQALARAAVVLLCFGLVIEWFVLTPPPSLKPPAEEDEVLAREQVAAVEGQQLAEQHEAPLAMARRAEKAAAPQLAELARSEPDEPPPRAAEPAAAPWPDQAPAGSAGPASLRLRVADLGEAAAQLRELIAGEGVDEPEAREDQAAAADAAAGLAARQAGERRLWTLRCQSAPACDSLNAWLRVRGAEAAFRPGEWLELRLEPFE